jgi:glycosyltransferase involved in cell wall biosynthesis
MTGPTLLHILVGAERGGCERNAEQIMRHLPVAHRVLVLEGDGPMVPAFRKTGAVVDLLSRTEISASSRFVTRISEYVTTHRPNAVIIWHGLVWLPSILYALRHVTGVIAVHGGNPAHTMPNWVDWKFRLLSIYYPLRRLPTYVCPTRYTADSFDHSHYLRRFPRIVVPNPIEVPTITPHQPRPLLPDQPLTVGMLARLDPIKDHSTLFQAMVLLQKSFPQARLELAGAGPTEPTLRGLASELGIAVEFLGDVSDVYRVMSRWDIFAYATTDREGLGNAAVEAMSLGLPCVVSDVGPLREVSGNSAAMLVPPADPSKFADGLISLARNYAQRSILARQAREWALSRFHPTGVAREYSKALGLPFAEPGTLRSSKFSPVDETGKGISKTCQAGWRC